MQCPVSVYFQVRAILDKCGKAREVSWLLQCCHVDQSARIFNRQSVQEGLPPPNASHTQTFTRKDTYTPILTLIHTYSNGYTHYTTAQLFLSVNNLQPSDCFRKTLHILELVLLFDIQCTMCTRCVLIVCTMCILQRASKLRLPAPTKWCRSAQHARCLSWRFGACSLSLPGADGAENTLVG